MSFTDCMTVFQFGDDDSHSVAQLWLEELELMAEWDRVLLHWEVKAEKEVVR